MTEQEQSQLRQRLADQFQNMMVDPPGNGHAEPWSAPSPISTTPATLPLGAGDRWGTVVDGGDWRGEASYRRPGSSLASTKPSPSEQRAGIADLDYATGAPAGPVPRWDNPPATPGDQPPVGRPRFAPTPSHAGPSPVTGTLAEWPQRALGYLIDSAPLLALYVIAIPVTAAAVFTPALWLLLWFVFDLAALGWAVFLAVQVGQSGSTPGMRLTGLRAVGKSSGQPIGAGMGILRAVAHIVDGLFFIGWLFPLWDADKQTLADKAVGTIVINVPKQGFTLTPAS